MKLAARSAVSPTANDPDAGPSPVSVATASGGSGRDAGSASQIRPHSVSVWVGSEAAAGDGAAEPPGTGVSPGDGDDDADGAADVTGGLAVGETLTAG
jgi:hypothetical protein